MKSAGGDRRHAPCVFMSRTGRAGPNCNSVMPCVIIFSSLPGLRSLPGHFGRKADLIRNLRPPLRACAFSHLPYPVLIGDEQIRYSRWGLIPYWLRRPEDVVTVRNQTVNARAETIFENASFRVPIRQRRCLVPVSGFYGWRHEQHRKIPLYVTLKERPLFSLAGIYDRWYCRATAAWTTTFSIITTEANPLMRYVNNANGRMPSFSVPTMRAAGSLPRCPMRRSSPCSNLIRSRSCTANPCGATSCTKSLPIPGILVPA